MCPYAHLLCSTAVSETERKEFEKMADEDKERFNVSGRSGAFVSPEALQTLEAFRRPPL